MWRNQSTQQGMPAATTTIPGRKSRETASRSASLSSLTRTLNGFTHVVNKIMLRLKDRQKSVPNGYSFYLPELKWSAPKNFPSFTVVCNALEAVVRANPYQAGVNRWPTDRKGIEDWVDLYNATICSRMGWDDYIVTDTGGSVPKAQPPHQQATLQSLRNAVVASKELIAGAKTLMEWEDSGEPPVTPEAALSRAIICTDCPRNDQGGFETWFTVPAAELIRRRVEKSQQRGLTTPRDELLHTCTACHCPLKLKVHVPIEWITKRLSPEQKSRLDPRCWILSGQ
jgi:hypothetical protein